MNWMLLPLRRYAEFSGRSGRREFWLFFLFMIVAGIVLGLVDTALGFGRTYSDVTSTGFRYNWVVSGPVSGLFTLAMLVPNLALTVRRLHDTDRSGWFLLLYLIPLVGAIVLLVFFCQKGTSGPNRFGPDPHGPDLASTFA